MTARERSREQDEVLSKEQARDVLAVLAARRLLAVRQAAPADENA